MILQPCPFCDALEYIGVFPISNVGNTEFYAVMCDNCGARGPSANSASSAAASWNKAHRRHQPHLVYSKDGMAYPARAPVDSTDAIGHQIGAGLPAETVEFYGPDIPPVPPVTVGQEDDPGPVPEPVPA
jgi:Lar family restriction alleviation protein